MPFPTVAKENPPCLNLFPPLRAAFSTWAPATAGCWRW